MRVSLVLAVSRGAASLAGAEPPTLGRRLRSGGRPGDRRGGADLGPHADVPAALAKVAEVLPLVILSNAADSQIRSNVDKLGAPFHAVLTAEQAKAYKP